LRLERRHLADIILFSSGHIKNSSSSGSGGGAGGAKKQQHDSHKSSSSSSSSKVFGKRKLLSLRSHSSPSLATAATGDASAPSGGGTTTGQSGKESPQREQPASPGFGGQTVVTTPGTPTTSHAQLLHGGLKMTISPSPADHRKVSFSGAKCCKFAQNGIAEKLL